MYLNDATCDQCGPAVKAKFIISLPSGNWLTYCIHCTNVHKEALEKMGAYIARSEEINV